MNSTIAIVTNAQASEQRSMSGYGSLLLKAARQTGACVSEFEGVSTLSRSLPARATKGPFGKAARDVERFVLSPLALAGRKADIVHVADPGNAIYLDVIRHGTSVVTVHDMIPYHCLAGRLQGFTPSRTGRLLMRRILAVLRRADRLVCVSQATRRDLIEIAAVDPERVSVITNAIFQTMQPACPQACSAIRRKLGIPADAKLIVHIGGAFYKNRRAVIEVFARLRLAIPNTFLLFVSAPSTELSAVISSNSLQAHVHFEPYIAPAELSALYTTASLLLFPSLYEGFGYPVIEAQLCGTPVICSDAGSLPEVAGDGARLFDPDDIGGMAEAAEELLSDEAAAATLVANGRQNVRRFAESQWFDAHSALYRELL